MSARDLSVQAIDALEEASQLEFEWNDLWERCPRATVFERPEWVLSSWRFFAPGTPRLLLVVRSGGKLVALVALRRQGRHGLEFEGAEVSDYLDALVDPDWQQTAIDTLFQPNTIEFGADPIVLDRLEATSPLLEEIPRRWPVRPEPRDVCPFVAIPERIRQLRCLIPNGFHARIQRSRRLVEHRATAEIRTATSEDVGVILDRLVTLHASRWHARGHGGAFAESAYFAFYRAAVPKLLARGLVWLLELQLSGQSAAAILSFLCNGRVLLYISGFAPEFARCSPGRLLLAEVFERALAQDCREIDFLRGVESYKYDWGARNRTTARLVLAKTPPLLVDRIEP